MLCRSARLTHINPTAAETENLSFYYTLASLFCYFNSQRGGRLLGAVRNAAWAQPFRSVGLASPLLRLRRQQPLLCPPQPLLPSHAHLRSPSNAAPSLAAAPAGLWARGGGHARRARAQHAGRVARAQGRLLGQPVQGEGWEGCCGGAPWRSAGAISSCSCITAHPKLCGGEEPCWLASPPASGPGLRQEHIKCQLDEVGAAPTLLQPIE